MKPPMGKRCRCRGRASPSAPADRARGRAAAAAARSCPAAQAPRRARPLAAAPAAPGCWQPQGQHATARGVAGMLGSARRLQGRAMLLLAHRAEGSSPRCRTQPKNPPPGWAGVGPSQKHRPSSAMLTGTHHWHVSEQHGLAAQMAFGFIFMNSDVQNFL